MQVHLHADLKDTSPDPLTEHLQGCVRHALGRFGERITDVEAHLCDVNRRTRSGYEVIHCTLAARLGSIEGVVVTERAYHAERAIDGAVRKLKRAVGTALARHDPRHPRAHALEQTGGDGSAPASKRAIDVVECSAANRSTTSTSLG